MADKTEENILDDLISILNRNPNDAKRKIGAIDIDDKSSENSRFHQLSSGKEDMSSDDQRSSSNSSKKENIIKKEKESPLPLQSIREKLKKDLEKKSEKNSNNFLSGKRFTFIPYDMELTAKRIGIFSENIKKKGGTVIPISSFVWDPRINSDIFIAIAKGMPFETLKNLVPSILYHEINRFTFVDCEWVTVCLQKNRFVDPNPYYIKWDDAISALESGPRQPIAKRGPKESNDVKNPGTNEAFRIKTNELDNKTQERNIGATFMEKNEDENVASVRQEPFTILDEKVPTNTYGYLYDYLYEPVQMRFPPNHSDKVSTSSEGKNLSSSSSKNVSQTKFSGKNNDTKIEDEQTTKKEPLFTKFETKTESTMKTEPYVKNEINTKKESDVKKEGGNTRNFTYIIDDNDDDLIYGGTTRKKLKLEESDVKALIKGTFLEGLQDLDKINTSNDGEVVELRDFKLFTPSSKKRRGKENETNEEDQSKEQKEEILLCQPETSKNLNAHITNELEKILKIYEMHQDKGRIHGYGKAIAIFKALPKKIESIDDIKNLVGIGTGVTRKVKEILATGKIKQAEIMKNDEKTRVLQLFDEVYGIGPATAMQLYNKGFRTIDDLRRNLHLFNDSQKVGLKYFEEFMQKIPRETVTEIFNVVKAKIDELSEYPGQYECICGGSYRRGRAFCGDVDVIMSPKDGKPTTGFLNKLIKSLEGTFLTDHLSLPTPDEHDGETYLGVCVYKGMHRRIDFKICARDRFGPLTIYYTGSNYFNRSIRIVAEKKGYNLENYGLYPAIRVSGTKYSLQNIPCYTEHDVFRILGLKYIPPEKRDI